MAQTVRGRSGGSAGAGPPRSSGCCCTVRATVQVTAAFRVGAGPTRRGRSGQSVTSQPSRGVAGTRARRRHPDRVIRYCERVHRRVRSITSANAGICKEIRIFGQMQRAPFGLGCTGAASGKDAGEGTRVWCARRCPVSVDRKQLSWDIGTTAPTVRECRRTKRPSWRWSPGRCPRPRPPTGSRAAAPGCRNWWPTTAPRSRQRPRLAPEPPSTTPMRSRPRRFRRACPPAGPGGSRS